MTIRIKNDVTRVPAAAPEVAIEHVERRMQLEADCWDVHAAQQQDDCGFVLLDVRSRELFEKGHVPGAVHLPHWEIGEARLAAYDAATLFVVYCAGPHCNGAQKGMLKLARLGRPVKEMIGGVEGWKDEGFELSTS